MIIFYDKDGVRLGKTYECGWSFSQKKNKEGTGKLDLIDYPQNAKYAELYRETEKMQTVVLTEHSTNDSKTSTSVKTLESLFKNYRIPENWHGWDKKPLSFVLADAIYGFDYIQKSTLEDFTDYIEKVNIGLNKIKDGDIHLDYREVGDSIHYYEKGSITFAFDCGDAVGQRYVRWVATTGEKVSISVQSASSYTPIVNIADVDFSASPVLSPRRDIEHDSSLLGVKIASDKRYVAVRFILTYHNADWIQDFATHKVYNHNNVLVDRTVRGFTPVIRAFEIITRKKTEFSIKSAPADMSELVEDIELSNTTLWDAIQKIREKYPFDTTCTFEKGRLFFNFERSLTKNKKAQAAYLLRANDTVTQQLNNTIIKELKQTVQKVNVMHCYGEGEKQQRLYLRIPETGTYDNLATVEDTFTDSKIKTREELKKVGLKKLKEKRKEDNPVFEVETLLPIRLFDEVSLVHPESNAVYEVTVQEEHISYKENKLTQKFGIGGFLFNPLSALLPQKSHDTERKIIKSPVGIHASGKQNAISITWEADGDDFVIRWKEKTQDFYNYRHTKQKQEVIERLKADTDYLFSVASVSDGILSDYTAEVVCRPLSADMSFPSDENALVHTCFDETPQQRPQADPSYTAWQSRIIEYDCTGKTDIAMTFAEALNNVIILSGELHNDFTLNLFFDKQNGNGTKQYLIVYKLTGYFNVIIGTEEAGTNKISQNITAKTFGLGCYAVVDFKGNVWAFEGNIKQSLIDEILQHAENKLNNSIEHTVNNFQNAVNSFFFEEKNKINIFIQEKMNEIKNYHKDRFIKLSGSIGEIRYFTRKNYTYGYLYANGYSFIPELYPEFYQFWLENFGDKKKKNYLGYDAFGYPKLPDLRGVSLRAVDDGANQGGVLQALEYQHDAIRNIRGAVGAFQIGYYGGFGTITGAFGAKHQNISTDSGTGGDEGRVINFDASRVVPTAEDNRVKSYGVYPFIKVI